MKVIVFSSMAFHNYANKKAGPEHLGILNNFNSTFPEV